MERLDAASFFKLVAELMKSNPPYAEDAPLMNPLKRIGRAQHNFGDLPKLGVEGLSATTARPGAELNGWVFAIPAGRCGTNYLQRASSRAAGSAPT